MSSAAVRLHALNLSERVRQRFDHLFGLAGRDAGLLVNEAVAEVVLADMDVPGAATHLAAYRERHPERPALLLARAPCDAGAADQLLVKPVVIRDLLLSLRTLRDTLTGATTLVGDDYADTVMPSSCPVAEPDAAATTSAAADIDDDAPTMVMPRRRLDALPDGDDATEVRDAGDPATVLMARVAGDAESTLMDRSAEPTLPARADDDTQVLPRTLAAMSRAEDDAARWAHLCGTRDDVDAESQDAVEALWLSADGLLLPRLAAAARQALDEQRVLELRAGAVKLVLDGASDYAYANRDEQTVQALCADGPVPDGMSVAPAGKPKAVLLSRSGNPTAHWATVESAVWQAALWTYCGRLPGGTDVSERVYLQRWPNFTRLVELPHALRIAALWVEQPVSLASTAEMLGVPQRYVFAFYGAAQALGLSGPARRGADNLFETPPAMLVPRRPLLGRLVRRLRAPAADGHAAPPSRVAG